MGHLHGRIEKGGIMFRTKGIFALVLLLASAGWGNALEAQRGRGGGGLGIYGFGPRLGENVHLALENRGQLGLSDEQTGALEELSRGIQEELAPLQADIDNLRYAIISGEASRVGGVPQLQGLVAEYDAVAEPFQTRITSILTVEQHAALQDIMFATRPGLGAGWGAGVGAGLGLAPGAGPGLGLPPRPYLGRNLGAGFGRGAGLGVRRGFVRGGGRGLGRRWWR